MKIIKRIFSIVWTLTLSVTAAFVYLFRRRPNLDLYKDYILAPTDENARDLRVTFLGVSTLLFDDNETAILTDGFFTRPGRLRTFFTKIQPDRELIDCYLKRAGIKKLNAIIVLHSHIDHAFDSAEVARQTHARLIGSESTANIGRGYGLPEEEIHVVKDGDAMCIGRFKIRLIRSCHSPISLLSRVHIRHVLLKGEIKVPLKLPARGSDYKEGGSYSLLIEHDGKKILVQASAGFKKGALDGQQADVVFLGIATVGNLSPCDQENYWCEVVKAVRPQRIIPIHWDDWSKPLYPKLVPMPWPFDNFHKSMEYLFDHVRETKIDVKILEAWIKVDPFAGI